MSIELPNDLSKCSVYSLAAYHDYFRRNQMLIRCSKIESEVMKRSSDEKITIGKLNYYKPLAGFENKMFNN